MARPDLRLLNATASADRLIFEEPADDLRRLEWYPRPLPWRFQEAATKVATAAFQAHVEWSLRNGWGAVRTCQKFDEQEINEIAVFAGEYRAECGTPYPHVAAGASIQRYGAAGPSQHPAKRYGKPVLRRCAKRHRWGTY